MSKTKIEWTNAHPDYEGESWNPVIGCKKVSEGCRNCYAEKMSIRVNAMAEANENDDLWAAYSSILKFDKNDKAIGFNGDINLMWDRLDIPLKKKKPTMFFVNSMSDLFHLNNPFRFIDKVFDVILTNPQHIYIILTKRPKQMLRYFSYAEKKMIELGYDGFELPDFVWLGVSVEDKKDKNRIDILRKIPAEIRWISFEPLLEDLGEIDLTGIHWVVVGGESGPNARPMHPDWVRGIRNQCKDAGVPFFFKQWGTFVPSGQGTGINFFWIGNNITFKKVGKAQAGNLLDGKQHLEYPIKLKYNSK